MRASPQSASPAGPAPGAPDPVQVVVASFQSHEEAAAAVDELAARDFPVTSLAIVGRGVRVVEDVTRRRTALGAAADGALRGALIGGLGAAALWAVYWSRGDLPGTGLIALALLVGAAIGALAGLALSAVPPGRHAFTAVASLDAESFDLVVDEPLVGEARRLLGQT